MNELTIHILAAVAQHEAKVISQRIKDALVVVKRKRGKLGGPNIETLSSNNRNEAIDFAKQHYDHIKTLRDDGLSYKKIATQLNRQRIPAVNGSGWNQQTVWNIFNKYKNEVCK